MKILVNYLDYNHNEERKRTNTYGGVGYYRLIKPAKFLAQIPGLEVDVMGKEAVHFGNEITNWDKVFQQYDVLWIASVYGDKNMSAIYYWAQHHGKKVIMDVDDNYLDLPESNEMYGKFAKGKRERALFSTAISFADIVTVSTEPLKERLFEHFKTIHGIEKKIYVIPNMNDLEDWNYTPAPKHEDKIVIGYAGSNSHQDDLVMVLPSIAKLMKKYDNLYVEVMGSIPKNKLDIYFGNTGFTDKILERISLVPSTATFKQYPEHLSKQKWDIGICPLVDTAFTRSKSHIKWMEYSSYKIPTVASRVYPYFMELNGKDTIQDGETGLLCTPKEWESKLERLINDKSLRQKLGENAYNFIKENWQYKDSNIKDIFSKILKDLSIT